MNKLENLIPLCAPNRSETNTTRIRRNYFHISLIAQHPFDRNNIPSEFSPSHMSTILIFHPTKDPLPLLTLLQKGNPIGAELAKIIEQEQVTMTMKVSFPKARKVKRNLIGRKRSGLTFKSTPFQPPLKLALDTLFMFLSLSAWDFLFRAIKYKTGLYPFFIGIFAFNRLSSEADLSASEEEMIIRISP